MSQTHLTSDTPSPSGEGSEQDSDPLAGLIRLLRDRQQREQTERNEIVVANVESTLTGTPAAPSS